MEAPKVISDLIEKFSESNGLSARFVGGAPTYEWTARASPEFTQALQDANVPFETFRANVKEHPDYGKQCVSFTVFGVTRRQQAEEAAREAARANNTVPLPTHASKAPRASR